MCYAGPGPSVADLFLAESQGFQLNVGGPLRDSDIPSVFATDVEANRSPLFDCVPS